MNFTPKKRQLLMACLFGLAIPCIAASTTTNSTPIQREVDKVMSDTRKQIDAISSSFESKDEKAQQEAYKKYQAIEKEAADKFLALSKKDPKDPGSADALVMVLFSARGSDEAKQALKTLKSDYLDSPYVTGLCFYLEHDQAEGPQVLEKIVQSNTNPVPKAAALLSLGRLVSHRDPQKAEKYFEEITAKYPNTKYEIFGRKMNFGEEAKNELFEIQHLGIGKQAPEITGEDIDGKKFSLSDYRGKVVLLDFWGDW